MINKKIMMLAIFFVCLFAAGTVSAADNSTNDIVGVENMTHDMLGADTQADVLSENGQSFSKLNNVINGNDDKEIYLNSDYTYSDEDDKFINGIAIDRDVTIYGNGHTINGSDKARIFHVIFPSEVVFYNITFVNGYADYNGYGGAIWGENCYAINCTFNDNHASYGGAMGCDDQAWYSHAINCNFNNNSAERGGAMYFGVAVGCNFTGNCATEGEVWGNAMFFSDHANCNGQPLSDFRGDELILRFDVDDLVIKGKSDKLLVNLVNDYNDFFIKYIGVDVTIFKDGRRLKTISCLSGDELSLDLEPGTYTAEFRVSESGVVCNPKNITITVANSFSILNAVINSNSNLSEIYLNVDYTFNSSADSDFIEGIVLNRDVTIYGNGHTINGTNKARIFYVESGYDVKLKDITFANGFIGDRKSGGAIYGEGKVINCTFKDNYADYGGGAIYWGYARNCTFINNRADICGGAIQSGTAVNCTFIDNSANQYGGALSWSSVVDCTFTGNSAPADYGGAMFGCHYLLCTDQSEEYSYCHDLSLWFDVDDISMYDDNEHLLINLMGSYNDKIIPLIESKVTIFKDNEQFKTYSSLSDDMLALDLSAGIYTAEFKISYPGLNPVPKNITLTVKKSKINIDVSAKDVTYPSDVVVNVKSDVGGEYTVKVGDKSQNILLDENVAKDVIFTGLAANENGYVVNVTSNNQMAIGCNDSVRVVVRKATPTIEVSGGDMVYGNVFVTVKSDVGGRYLVTAGDLSKIITLDEGVTQNVDILWLPASEEPYDVNVTYEASENYTAAFNDSAKLTVHKGTANIKVTADNAVYPGNVVVHVESDVNGLYDVNVGDIYKPVVLFAGFAQEVVFTGLAANEDGYVVNVTFDTQNVVGCNDSVRVIVHKATPNIEVSAGDVIYGNIFVTVKSDVGGRYVVNVGKFSHEVILVAGVAQNVSIIGLSASEAPYDVNVTYGATGNYTDAFNDTAKLTVHKYGADIKVAALDAVYPGSVDIYIESDSTGQYVVNVGGMSQTVFLYGGFVEKFVFRGLAANENGHVVNVTHDSQNVTGCNDSVRAIVHKAAPNIEVSAGDVIYGNSFVTVRSDVGGTYVVNAGGISQEVTLAEDVAQNVTIVGLDASDVPYVVNVTYAATENYTDAFNDDAMITVHKYTATINVAAFDVTYPDSVVVNVESDVTGIYVVNVGDMSQTVGLFSFIAQNVVFAGVAANESGYVVNVSHESQNIVGCNDSVRVVVHKATPNIEVSAVGMPYPYGAVVNVKSDVDGNYIVNVGDMSQTVYLSAGVIENLLFNDLAANEAGYVVNVTYAASENYTDAFNDSIRVVVNKATPIIYVYGSDATYPGDVVVKIMGSADGEYTVKCGNNEQKINLTAFEVKQIEFSQLKPQEYLINATYDETDNYTMAINDTVKVNVAKMASSVVINNIADTFYNRELIISFNVEKRTTVRGVITKDGKEVFNQTITENYISPKLNAGYYTISIYNEESETTNSSSDTKSFNILKINTTIIPAVSEGSPTIITVNVDSNATGYVTMGVGGLTFIAPVNNGEAVFTFDFKPGTYGADISYIGNDNYNNNSTSVLFTVTEQIIELKNTTLSVDVSSIENDVTITAEVNVLASGLVEFNIDGKAVYIAVNNGKAVYTTNLPAGEYNVGVTYMGDSRFNANRTSKAFTVTGHVKKNTTLISNVEIEEYKVILVVDVDKDATGFVEFKLNDNIIYSKVDGGKAVMESILFPDEYTVKATYLGDDNFNTNTTDITFTVDEILLKNTTIDADVKVFENNVTITVNVDKNATGFVEFDVSGAENYTLFMEVKNGVAILEDVLSIGDYKVEITYLGDFNFNMNATSETFTVVGHIKNDTEISVSAAVDRYTVTITSNVDSAATGYVTIALLGQTFIVPVDDGKAVFTYDFNPGTYAADVTYLGDDNYNNASTTVSFTVTKQVVELKNTTIEVVVESIENNVSIIVNVDKTATGLVEFVIDGDAVYIALNNGEAVYDVVLPGGDYNVAVTYLGDGKFNPNSTTESFTVQDHVKLDTGIKCDVDVEGYEVTVAAIINESTATGFVEFNIGSKKYYAPVEEGKALLVVDLPPGAYSGNIKYIGDENFKSSVTLLSFNVLEQNVTLENTAVDVIVSSHENDVSIVAVVNSSATGLVEVIVGDTVVYLPISNGEAGYEIMLPGGEYNATVTYLGDARFNPNSTTKAFVVYDHIKLNTTINCDVDVNNNTVAIAANVNSLAGGFVEFNIAGKKYYIPVENGKAVLVNDFLAGTYMGNVHYLGDDNFNDAATLVSFTVTEKNDTLENTSIEVVVGAMENDVSIIAKVNESATGLVEFVIDGQAVYIAVNNGEAVYDVILAGGDYNVTVTYMGDSRFNPNTTTEEFTVQDHVKLNTEIKCDVDVDDFEVTLTAVVNESDATGFVEFNIASKKYYAPVNGGKAVFAADFIPGTYSGNIKYLGDENFKSSTMLVSFTVLEQNVTLQNTSLEVIVSSHENDVSIVAVVNSSATGLVEVIVGDTVVYLPISNGEAGYEIMLPGGEYNATVTYLGDARFNPNSTTKAFVVYDHIKGNTTITCDVVVDNYTVTIAVNVNSLAGGFVEFNIAGKKYYAPVENGKAVLVNDFLAGTYMGNVHYLGDDNFNDAATLVSFTVTEKNDTLENTSIEVVVGAMENDVSIIAKVNESATGLVEFVIDGQAVYIAVNNGEAVYDVILAGGDYNVTVTYLGDSRFNPNSTTEEFTVQDHVKLNTEIKCDVDVDDFEVTLTAAVNESDATGFVEFNIAGKKYYAPVENGKAVLVNDFLAGNYMGNVHYLGDDNFNEATTLVYFNVTEKNGTLENTTLDVIVSSHENDVSIVAVVNSSATGLVEVIVGDSVVYLPISNGEAGYEIMLPGGEYNATVTYLGDARFNPNSTTKEFVVYDHIKGNTTITSDVVVDGYNVTVTVNVDSKATGFVKFVINDNNIFVEVNDGKAVINNIVPAGKYLITATYMGDDDFNVNTTEIEVIVEEIPLKNTTIDAEVDVYKNNVTITVNVDENATGFVEFNVYGAEEYKVYVAVADGKATLEDVLSVGNYTVQITYLGDFNFNKNSTTQNFTVLGHVKKDTSIKAIPAVSGSTVTVDVGVDKNATGFVTIAVLGQTFIVPVEDGKSVFTYDFNPGVYNANVVYLGDDDFNNASTTVSFTVIKQVVVLKNTTIDVSVDSIENDVTITANVNSLATGLIEFNIGGKSVYLAVNNGNAVYSTELTAGEYNVVVTYLGDSKFNANTTSKEFVVVDHIKQNTTISAEVAVDGSVATIISNVNSNASGFVEFNIGGEDVYIAIKDGKAVYSTVLPNGDYVVLIRYAGDNDFNGNSTVKEFSISNIVPKATEFTNIDIGSGYVITARLVDEDGNALKGAVVKYVVGNVSGSTETDAEGVFRINAQSDCVVFMEFEGNSTFLAANISIKIDKLESEKLASQFNVTEGISIKTYAVDSKAGEIGKTTSFRLTDSNGDPIVNATVKFAYKTVIFNRTTDENGIVSIGISTQFAQQALCAMSYLGDEKYNATFVAFSFNIQSKPITISASAKTFKKSTKTKKYTVTLKTQKCNSRDGKVYLSSGKKVTLKINGKTYTAKTNSKGQATFKITKLTKRAKYVAVIKFAGDKTYSSASKKVKITVK